MPVNNSRFKGEIKLPLAIKNLFKVLMQTWLTITKHHVCRIIQETLTQVIFSPIFLISLIINVFGRLEQPAHNHFTPSVSLGYLMTECYSITFTAPFHLPDVSIGAGHQDNSGEL